MFESIYIYRKENMGRVLKQTSDMKWVKYSQLTDTVSNTKVKLLEQRPAQLTDCVDFEGCFAHRRRD